MGATYKLEELQFTDLERFGSFYNRDTYEQFKDTPLGEAGINCVKAGIEEQMQTQNVVGYEVNDDALYRIFYREQLAQRAGTSRPEMTDEEILDSHAPDWLQKVGTLTENWSAALDTKVAEIVQKYGPSSINPDDESYAGQGGAWRKEAIDAAVNGP